MTHSEANDRDAYLKEYTDDDTVARYVSNTAGSGIQYLMHHVYGPLYSEIIDSICGTAGTKTVFRVLEYGCGAGMNLLHISGLLASKGVPEFSAVGTDFSKPLIHAAREERDALVGPEYRNKIRFQQASNESLLKDLEKEASENESSLRNRFSLIVGVNTFRYAARLNKQQDCANDIASLLAPGGYSIMIDMNNKFPLFKSRRRDRQTKPGEQIWLPTLDEYTAPFRTANLEILQARHFCWIPHSANSPILIAARLLTPVLDCVAPSFAMRSLVVARKIGETR